MPSYWQDMDIKVKGGGTEGVQRAVQWLCRCTATGRLGKALYRLQRLVIK